MLRAQDWELNYRLRQSGRLVWFSPELRVTYRPRSTLKALIKQMYDTGKWRREVVRRHPDTASVRYLAPPAAVVAIGVGSVGACSAGRTGSRFLQLGALAPVGYAAFVAYVMAAAPRDPLAARRAAGCRPCWPPPTWPGAAGSWSAAADLSGPGVGGLGAGCRPVLRFPSVDGVWLTCAVRHARVAFSVSRRMCERSAVGVLRFPSIDGIRRPRTVVRDGMCRRMTETSLRSSRGYCSRQDGRPDNTPASGTTQGELRTTLRRKRTTWRPVDSAPRPRHRPHADGHDEDSESRRLDTRRPFTSASLHSAAGLTVAELAGPRVSSASTTASTWPPTSELTVAVRAQAALLVAPDGSYASHHTAVALWGGWAPTTAETHISSPVKSTRSERRGIVAHAADPDVGLVDGRGSRSSPPARASWNWRQRGSIWSIWWWPATPWSAPARCQSRRSGPGGGPLHTVDGADSPGAPRAWCARGWTPSWSHAYGC